MERRRPGPAARDGRAADTSRLAISDFALVRQSRWREAIASIFDDPEFLPYLRSLRRIAVTYAHPRRDRARRARPTWSSRSTTSAGWPRGSGCRWSSRWRRSPAARARRRRGRARAAGTKPAMGRGARRRRCPTAGPRSRSSSGRSMSAMPPGTTLRVELLAERRGSELRADVTAEAETVHVRVWQDGVEALDRHFRAAAADGRGPAGRGDRGRPARPGRGRRAPLGGRASSDRPAAEDVDVDASRASSIVADPAAAATRRRGPDRRRSWPTRSRRAAGPTGRRPVARRRSGSTGGSSRRRCATPCRGRRPRLVGRRPLRPARPPALERQGVRRHPARHRRRRGGHGRRRSRAAAASPSTTSTRSRPARRSAEARGAAWCAATLADELRAAGLDEVDGWPVFDLMLLGVGPDGHLLSVFPDSAAFDSPELALAIPAPTHIEPHVERVTLNPAVIGVAREVLVVANGADKAAVIARHLRARARPAALARPARPARRGDLDPRRGRRRGAPALTVADRAVAPRHRRPTARRSRVFSERRRPPLVLVHGATADHTTFRVVGPLLAPHVHGPRHRSTRPRGVRRHAAYAIEREFEDVAAVADALAASAAGRSTSSATRMAGGARSGRPCGPTRSAGSSRYEGAPTPPGQLPPAGHRDAAARPA